MANHKSAEKAIRKALRRTEINKNRISRIRTFVKKVEGLISLGKAVEAKDALKVAEKELKRGVSKGVIHLNTASRKVSRLTKRVKALAAA
jgi:small subunit ribosomal protein S20